MLKNIQNSFYGPGTLKKFVRKFQVSYLSFCTANEGESTTIKKKEKVCNTAQQLNIVMSFVCQI
jgi:hypothetical protein